MTLTRFPILKKLRKRKKNKIIFRESARTIFAGGAPAVAGRRRVLHRINQDAFNSEDLSWRQIAILFLIDNHVSSFAAGNKCLEPVVLLVCLSIWQYSEQLECQIFRDGLLFLKSVRPKIPRFLLQQGPRCGEPCCVQYRRRLDSPSTVQTSVRPDFAAWVNQCVTGTAKYKSWLINAQEFWFGLAAN